MTVAILVPDREPVLVLALVSFLFVFGSQLIAVVLLILDDLLLVHIVPGQLLLIFIQEFFFLFLEQRPLFGFFLPTRLF